MTPALLTIPAILVLCFVEGTPPAAQDCLMSIVPEQGTNAPYVVDVGSTTSTHGVGCDGCTVDTVRIKVTWAHTDGAWVSGAGANLRFDVTAGDISMLTWPAHETLECDETATVSVSQPVPVGSGTGTSYVRFKCNMCQ